MNADVIIHGERLQLRSDRSLFWPERRTLIIADPHFGKHAAFRVGGVPLPGSPSSTLARLASALEEARAERLIVLGDFWHAREGRSDEVLTELAKWRAKRPGLRIDLIRGNHDRAGSPPDGWAKEWINELDESPFRFRHMPETVDHAYTFSGHQHPGVVIRGPARQRVRVPCFVIGGNVGVLPAFGDFTGENPTERQVGDQIFAIAGDEVIELPLGSLTSGNE